MTSLLYTVTLKSGNGLKDAFLYHKDNQHHVFIQPQTEHTQVPGNDKKYSFLMVANDQITAMTPVPSSPQQQPQPQQPTFKPLPLDKIMKKAQKTAQSRQLQLMRLSGQIDDFAMRLFMSLSKTVPCKWYFEESVVKEERAKPTAIVIFDDVVINPPYRREDFYPTPTAAPATIDWIGKVIEREREKLVGLNQQ